MGPLGSAGTQELAAKGCWGGRGRAGPVPLRGVAVTQRALFFAGEQDGHPEGEIQGVGPPGRGGLHRQQKQQRRRSGHLTKSSTMGEYEGRVGATWGAVAGPDPTWGPHPRAEPTETFLWHQ